jgi:hypothetical protein
MPYHIRYEAQLEKDWRFIVEVPTCPTYRLLIYVIPYCGIGGRLLIHCYWRFIPAVQWMCHLTSTVNIRIPALLRFTLLYFVSLLYYAACLLSPCYQSVFSCRSLTTLHLTLCCCLDIVHILMCLSPLLSILPCPCIAPALRTRTPSWSSWPTRR